MRERYRTAVAFYRVRSCAAKVSGQRYLGYTVLGSFLGAHTEMVLVGANLVMVSLILAFVGAYGNYWDWMLTGESNSTERAAHTFRLSLRRGFLATWIPLACVGPLLAWGILRGMSMESVAALGVVAALGIVYFTPGLRFKTTPVGVGVTPLVAVLLFGEAFGLHSGRLTWSPTSLALCGLLALFQTSAELLHLWDDGLHEAGGWSYWDARAVTAGLRYLPPIAIIVSGLLAVWVHPAFLTSVCSWGIRWCALRRLTSDKVSNVRRRLYHPVWMVYEFAVYIAINTMHPFLSASVR